MRDHCSWSPEHTEFTEILHYKHISTIKTTLPLTLHSACTKSLIDLFEHFLTRPVKGGEDETLENILAHAGQGLLQGRHYRQPNSVG